MCNRLNWRLFFFRSFPLFICSFFYSPSVIYSQEPNASLADFTRIHQSYIAAESSDKTGILDSFNLKLQGLSEPDQVVSYLFDQTQNFYENNQWQSFQRTNRLLELVLPRLSSDAEKYGPVLNVLAIHFELSGDIEKAATYYYRVVNWSKEINEKRGLLTGYLNLGILECEKGAHKEALSYFEMAIDVSKQIEQPKNYRLAECYKEAAKAVFELGDLEKANRYFEESLSHIPENANKYFLQIKLYNLQGLARIYLAEHRLNDAKAALEKSLSLAEKASLGFDLQVSYHLLGELYTEQNDYPAALNQYQLALQMAEKEFGVYERHIDIALCLGAIARTYLSIHQPDSALVTVQKALVQSSTSFSDTIYKENPVSDKVIFPIEGLKLLELKGDILTALYAESGSLELLQTALFTYQAATNLIQEARLSYQAKSTKTSLATKVQGLIEKAIVTAMQLHEKTHEDEYVAIVYDLMELNKAQIFLESIQGKNALGWGGVPVSLIDEYVTLQKNASYYQKILAIEQQKNISTHDRINTLSRKVFESQETLKIFIADLEKKYPAYLDFKNSPITGGLNDLQNAISDDSTAIISYYIGPSITCQLFISNNELQLQPLKESSLLIRDLTNFLPFIQSPPSGQEEDFLRFIKTSNTLYQDLFPGGIIDAFPGVKRWVIIPDHQLALLPFGVLIQELPSLEKGAFHSRALDYFLKEFTISYAISGQFYMENQMKKKYDFKRRLRAYAPSSTINEKVELRNCTTGEMAGLVCSDKEVTSIVDVFGGQTLIGASASKEDFLKWAKQVQVLHFATHACINESDPMLSQIWFADDYLTNYGLTQLDLNTELAVLSACNTGIGRLAIGEGMQSLSRGFFQAGCNSLVNSLWSVDDCSTAGVMTHFYRYLNMGMEKDLALRKAKLSYLESSDRYGAHPFFWAGFVQSGNYAALSAPGNSWHLILFFLVGVILFISWLYRNKKQQPG